MVLRCDARMRMPLATSRTLRAQQKHSLGQCGSELWSTNCLDECDFSWSLCVSFHRFLICSSHSFVFHPSVAFGNGSLVIHRSQDGPFGDRYTEDNSSLKFRFLRLRTQRSLAGGVRHLASEPVIAKLGRSSIRHVVEFVVTAAAVLPSALTTSAKHMTPALVLTFIVR